MSVDLVGTLRTPISLDALVTTAGETVQRLLGLGTAPVVEVFEAVRYEENTGRPLSARALRSTTIGGHVAADLFEQSVRRRFDFEVAPGTGARLMVFDRCGGAPDATHDVVDAAFTPVRTCSGVVVATALALAAATRGGGEFVDVNIMMTPSVSDPEQVVELTRLRDRGEDFVGRCERYLRQFAALDAWPPADADADAENCQTR
ncbi:hypothetical protein [Lentzea sp. NPDC059081]|uniref:hypothetical protein n=1 Tax=Lentzea sp. NPDC059081 TaxID=3346719 RepID=UPI0036941090